MRVLDLFSGLEGWSEPWRAAGHSVHTLDNDPHFSPTFCMDVRDFVPREPYDVVLASPPCETFSVASIGHHWTGGKRAYVPKTQEAADSLELVEATIDLIVTIQPKVAVIENPRGVLRKLGLIPTEPVTVWYCHYGEKHAKPTDLWGLPFPERWQAEPQCHNRRDGHEPGCCCYDHEQARRGAKTGTQGIDGYAKRSLIPQPLAVSIMEATLAA